MVNQPASETKLILLCLTINEPKNLNMKKITLITIVIVSALFLAFKTFDNAIWSLDKAHAKLSFSITHMTVSDVEGRFKTFDAKVTASKADFSDAVAEMTADVNSINTDNEMRDKHLQSPDYFDAVKYPVITFKSKTFIKVDDKSYKVTGELSMHGITKTIELDAICKMGTNPMSNQMVAGFKITGVINRTDFNIGTSVPFALLGDEVTLVCNAEFIKN
jgi:polyisoprenoid-binding protein YceI